jgi:hypothetical protein
MLQNLLVNAVIAGVLFAAWPLIMKHSGLPGNPASVALCFAAFLVILPFAAKDFGSFAQLGLKQ